MRGKKFSVKIIIASPVVVLRAIEALKQCIPYKSRNARCPSGQRGVSKQTPINGL